MRDIRNEFIPYGLAFRMKQLGFDEPCFGWYEHNSNFYYCYQEGLVPPSPSKKLIKGAVKAPTFQQAFRWFRDNYGLIGDPIPLSTSKNGPTTHYGWNICSSIDAGVDWENDDDGFKTYEEAQLACLEELIDIVEQKEKEI
jgi:hypothetical protein